MLQSMLHQENSAVIINTGSKQGITNPPYVNITFASSHMAHERIKFRGNPAYNASKAAVKSLTESLAHDLRQRKPAEGLTAHLFM